MPVIKNCCCCSLRTGTLIIGWLELIGGICGILLTILMMIFMTDIEITIRPKEIDYKLNVTETPETIEANETEMTTDPNGKAAYAFMMMILSGILIYYICFTILAVFLIIGVRKQNMRYIRIWVQVKTILLFITFVGIVMQLFLMLMDFDSNLSDQIIVAVIDGLLILAVHSYYETVTDSTVPTY
ncbi:hypothetical protein O3M35_013329 [Rhynocoris fuscipes]|uniref:Uncharacterized protein n=1 Tax=Rhynocoris fuscipes TaxID=488301 RepID=A0AAW1CEN6_9HEMI